MAKEYAIRFYNSKRWQKCRESYLSSVFYICELCGHSAYIVHHKVHITPSNINDADITLGHGNLQAVCIDCHNQVHGSVWRALEDGLMWTEDGDIVKVDTPLSLGE